ncbi:MAG TPA: hypothetical protein DCX54_10415, partial [Flavobacteriales bacterium]|nr:hypothetical protein [Flavobacteriales bacterium]
TTAVEVRVNPLPLITAMLDTTIFLGDQVKLKAFAGVSYIWSGGYEDELSCSDCAEPIAIPIFNSKNRDNRVYYVIGTDSNNCHNMDSVIISLNPRVVIFVPTAFSPNGDGYNDVLKVETKGIERFEFEVYDRYGRTVFETRDFDGEWDGTYEGELLGKDVFMFRITAKPFKSGIPIEQAGQISLIR